MANKSNDKTAPVTRQARQRIIESETYTRGDLLAMRQLKISLEFLMLLEEFFGLLPLGSDVLWYTGKNLIEAHERHAQDQRLQSKLRKPPQLRALRQAKKSRKGLSA